MAATAAANGEACAGPALAHSSAVAMAMAVSAVRPWRADSIG
jgi:hypothetical protein